MSEQKPLAYPRDVIYQYDGSLPGFFCCVHESVYEKELPSAIISEDKIEPSLFSRKSILTDEEKTRRVHTSIPQKISPRALKLVRHVFLSCLENRELALLRFLLLGYQKGGSVVDMMGHPDVAVLLKAEGHLFKEQQLLMGFVRFSDYGGKLAATITPKNFILPFLADHFMDRYPNEDFMIFDKTHKAALIYENRRAFIVALDRVEPPPASEAEDQYRRLWKQFYKTVAIQERYNPKCRMTHMPKRYWENMTEMQELL